MKAASLFFLPSWDGSSLRVGHHCEKICSPKLFYQMASYQKAYPSRAGVRFLNWLVFRGEVIFHRVSLSSRLGRKGCSVIITFRRLGSPGTPITTVECLSRRCGLPPVITVKVQLPKTRFIKRFFVPNSVDFSFKIDRGQQHGERQHRYYYRKIAILPTVSPCVTPRSPGSPAFINKNC